MRRRQYLATAVLVLGAGCGSDVEPSSSETKTPTDTATASPTTSPLDQMVVVFEGDYSRREIKSRMDTVLTQYGLDVTEDNYNGLGSVLVSLNNERGVPEMDILACMHHADLANQEAWKDKPPSEVLSTAATLCAIQLES